MRILSMMAHRQQRPVERRLRGRCYWLKKSPVCRIGSPNDTSRTQSGPFDSLGAGFGKPCSIALP